MHTSDSLYLGAARTGMGATDALAQAGFIGSIASNVLTVTSIPSGSLGRISVGMALAGPAIAGIGPVITGFLTGNGGIGTYSVSNTADVTSGVLVAFGTIAGAEPSEMSVGVGPLGRVFVWDILPVPLTTDSVAGFQLVGTNAQMTITAGRGTKRVIGSAGQVLCQLDVPRALQVTTGPQGGAGSSTITIVGYDIYGQKMSESILASFSQSASISGKKAFFQIESATCSTAAGTTTIAIGTSDVFGIPVRVNSAAYISSAKWGSSMTQDTGTFAGADTSLPTKTTGDVRGTYKPSSAADGVKRLVAGIFMTSAATGSEATRAEALGLVQA
jgi:hypothetical protein